MILRQSYIDKIEKAFTNVPIVTLIGARQVGKTSIMKLYSADKSVQTLFLNGQDIDVAVLFEHFSTIEHYLQVYMNEEIKGLLLIDEFQYINGISTQMKLLTDKYPNLHILCSGSSSLDIFQNVEESLAGRVRIIEVLSLSFEEYLQFRDESQYQLYKSAIDGKDENLFIKIQQLYSEYIIYGGFPRVALTSDYEEKIELINDIYQTYLLNDVRHYIRNEHFVGFGKLLRLLAAQIGNLVNVNELSKESGLQYEVCDKYIHLLQQMYIIRLVSPFASNKRKVINKMQKVYFYDLGLRNIIYHNFNEIDYRIDKGALFENEIMLELWRNLKAPEELNFYRMQNGSEVDFFVNGTRRRYMVECKHKRFEKPISIPSLSNIAQDEGVNELYIANINLDAENKGVRLIPGFIIGKL